MRATATKIQVKATDGCLNLVYFALCGGNNEYGFQPFCIQSLVDPIEFREFSVIEDYEGSK